MVEFQQVCMAYKEKEVLNNVDLTIQDGEFFVLIGSLFHYSNTSHQTDDCFCRLLQLYWIYIKTTTVALI